MVVLGTSSGGECELSIRKIMLGLMASCFSTIASAEIDVTIGYLKQEVPAPPVLSNLESIPEDEGLAGSKVAIQDNATTGKFLKHNYTLEEKIIEEGGDFLSAAKEALQKTRFLVVNAPKKQLLEVADLPEAEGAIIFNASEGAVSLRSDECRANVLHTIPSRSMLSDALAQFALKKRWTKWALIHGTRDGDLAYKSALERSAKKYGVQLVGQKEWNFDADMRRNAPQEVPLFTQDFDDHDLMVIADEPGDFGRYVFYNTWLPRPVAGSEGVVPVAWSASVEQHGAAQLQSRFKEQSGRAMRSIDYAAWAAVRSVGEAVTRTNSADVVKVREFLFSDKFKLAGFKGRPLTFRKWNGQLRQPIPLTHPRAIVALAPLDGYLHERNELDTLGLDLPESNCTAFEE